MTCFPDYCMPRPLYVTPSFVPVGYVVNQCVLCSLLVTTQSSNQFYKNGAALKNLPGSTDLQEAGTCGQSSA